MNGDKGDAGEKTRRPQALSWEASMWGKGGSVEYRIVDMPAFRFAGVSARVPLQYEGENPAIARLAESVTDEQRAEMRRLMDLDPREVVNVSWDSDTDFQREEGELTHLIGVLTTRPAAEVGAGLEKGVLVGHGSSR